MKNLRLIKVLGMLLFVCLGVISQAGSIHAAFNPRTDYTQAMWTAACTYPSSSFDGESNACEAGFKGRVYTSKNTGEVCDERQFHHRADGSWSARGKAEFDACLTGWLRANALIQNKVTAKTALACKSSITSVYTLAKPVDFDQTAFGKCVKKELGSSASPTPSPNPSSSSTANTTSKVPGANTFCKSYPLKESSTEVSRARCINAYEAGYSEGGAGKSTVCPKASFSGAKLTSCNKAYDKGKDKGEADRKKEKEEAEAAAKEAADDTHCNGKGIKISSAWGLGGCIGGGNQNPIFALVGFGIQFLTGLFGIILVLVLVIAGFQYVISGDDPEIAKEAKERIKGAVTGLVLFVIMFALIQVILPDDIKIFNS